MQVLGVSFDAPVNNAAFKKNESFDFDLLTDEDRELALAYGAASSSNQFFADRTTVIVDDMGQWVLVYPSGTLGALYQHPQIVLDDLAILVP